MGRRRQPRGASAETRRAKETHSAAPTGRKPASGCSPCACLCAPLPCALWELLDSLDAYAYDSRIWLRVLPEDFEEPLPEGATLIATKRVSYGVA
ncbi:hypothetical protein [Nocardiopsis sp. NRRL B-16309]|uniref:hypothetical protein n=1 Tax=Nocardiopsis sp. NRRL B-16309 TaxID=1519494 RepID=UPI0006AFA2EC|nr:hypothetical protein [Nocardiopsis sp. NRRL B-16309]KOX22069.1 hypothetical protein ADL05_03255 [Nocardiopsis sp. NRRL B-16309]